MTSTVLAPATQFVRAMAASPHATLPVQSVQIAAEQADLQIEGSLYPNWAGETQVRPYTVESGQLVLSTPPMRLPDGTTVVNELAWERERA